MNRLQKKTFYFILTLLFLTMIISCKEVKKEKEVQEVNQLADTAFTYKKYSFKSSDKIVSRSAYLNKLYGFWLGECIANWTGLVTEMDKIGNIGPIKTGAFYTREDWGKPDQPSIWSDGVPSNLSKNIDFVFRDEDEIWGSDDDTDIEYMYQYLLYTQKTSVLTGEQIKEGWLRHIMPEEENFLWVANQKALDMMLKGHVPPDTSDPKFTTDTIYDNYYEMIDAQLTTEIFGFFAPARPDIALEMAKLPILTTARKDAKWISEFNVIMYSLASYVDENLSMKEKIHWMSDKAREHLPKDSYPAKMFDFVKSCYDDGMTWEQARDAVYTRYQVNQEDGYHISSKDIYCNGCFVGGINFAASIVSLLYGEGNLVETIKIGALAGWDSDNPTATWGGLLGFMYGKEGVEKAFGRTFSDKFNIHRTRQNFPNEGLDNFNNMAKIGVFIIDRVVQEQMGGGIDLNKDVWYIPDVAPNMSPSN